MLDPNADRAAALAFAVLVSQLVLPLAGRWQRWVDEEGKGPRGVKRRRDPLADGSAVRHSSRHGLAHKGETLSGWNR